MSQNKSVSKVNVLVLVNFEISGINPNLELAKRKLSPDCPFEFSFATAYKPRNKKSKTELNKTLLRSLYGTDQCLFWEGWENSKDLRAIHLICRLFNISVAYHYNQLVPF